MLSATTESISNSNDMAIFTEAQKVLNFGSDGTPFYSRTVPHIPFRRQHPSWCFLRAIFHCIYTTFRGKNVV